MRTVTSKEETNSSPLGSDPQVIQKRCGYEIYMKLIATFLVAANQMGVSARNVVLGGPRVEGLTRIVSDLENPSFCWIDADSETEASTDTPPVTARQPAVKVPPLNSTGASKRFHLLSYCDREPG